MKIKKIDISSILPIVIKIIKDIFELVKSLEKSIVSKPYKLEALVLVKVSKDNLKELSKFILSNNKTPESTNKLTKNIQNIGYTVLNSRIFDTITITEINIKEFKKHAQKHN